MCRVTLSVRPSQPRNCSVPSRRGYWSDAECATLEARTTCRSISVSAVLKAEAAALLQCNSVWSLKHTQVNKDRPSAATHGFRCVSGASFRSLGAPRSTPIRLAAGNCRRSDVGRRYIRRDESWCNRFFFLTIWKPSHGFYFHT